jgi:hypothetical protein
MHQGDLERGILKQQPTLDITHSRRYQIRAHVDKIRSDVIQSAGDTIAALYGLDQFQSDLEHLEFIEPLLVDNMYHVPGAEHVEGCVCSPNPTQRISKPADTWPASTLLPGATNPRVYLHAILSLG